ncbi:MAG TPA: S1/P1 nuclease [bacterium]|nr:S1/P1 nuclease [bacterium]
MSAAARIHRAAAAHILLPAATTGFLLIVSCRDALAWGWRGHEIINRRAVELLPEPAHAAWSPFAAQLVAQANDADDRKDTSREESPRHFINIDVYGPPPFEIISHDRQVLEKEHGVDEVRRRGIIPWAIEETYADVVAALKQGDWAQASTRAADLGHYVADVHQPLHCTKNFDGQFTGNKGVHYLFEVTMLDRYLQESMLASSATVPEMAEMRAADLCFLWVAEAYDGIEPILEADRAARALDSSREDLYLEHLWEGTREVAIRQIDSAARDLAILLQAAWVEAGSPPSPANASIATDGPSVWQERAAHPKKSDDEPFPIGLTIAGIVSGIIFAMYFVGSD